MNLSFLTLLQRAVRGCGLNPENLGDELAACFATWLQARVESAWRAALWPETIALEERSFRPAFSLAATYALDDEVFDEASGTYFRAVQDGFTGHPVSDASFWSEATDLLRSIPMVESGDTIIAEPLQAWTSDPRRNANAAPLNFWHDGAAIYFPQSTTATVWLRFRLAPPRFTTVPFDVTAAYAIDDLFYFTTGNTPALRGHCYRVLAGTLAGQTPETHPAKFAVQSIPDTFANYAARAAGADWLSDDGQGDKALAQERLASGWLTDRLADLTILQGQHASQFTVS